MCYVPPLNMIDDVAIWTKQVFQEDSQNTKNVKSYESYLDDIVSSFRSNDKNIENRYNMGIGSVVRT